MIHGLESRNLRERIGPGRMSAGPASAVAFNESGAMAIAYICGKALSIIGKISAREPQALVARAAMTLHRGPFAGQPPAAADSSTVRNE
ncbi:MAG: hypothetical protein WA005_18585 [Candidatus Binataceae bacterium]